METTHIRANNNSIAFDYSKVCESQPNLVVFVQWFLMLGAVLDRKNSTTYLLLPGMYLLIPLLNFFGT